MTIETGVVTGNIDRVKREIDELLTAVIFKHGAEAVVDIKDQLAALEARAAKFVTIISVMDQALATKVEKTAPITVDDQSSAPETDKEDPAAIETLSPELVDHNKAAVDVEPVDQPDPTKSESTGRHVDLQMQFDALQVQLSEIVIRLDTMNKTLTNLNVAQHRDTPDDQGTSVGANVAVTIPTVGDFITAVKTDSNDNAKLYLVHLRSHPTDINSELVKEIMITLGEVVMQPNSALVELFQILSTADEFSDDQRQVLGHLFAYHADRQNDPGLPILPSPWERGMKNLF